MAGSIRTSGTQYAGVGRNLLAAGVGAVLVAACTLGPDLPPPASDGTLPPVILVPADTTLFDIARHYDLPPRDLVALNGLQPPFTVTEGQVLRLPSTALVPPATGVAQTPSAPFAPSTLPAQDTAPPASPRPVEVVPLAPAPASPSPDVAAAATEQPVALQPVPQPPIPLEPVEIPSPTADAAPGPVVVTIPPGAADIPAPPSSGTGPAALPSVEAGEPPPSVVAAPAVEALAAPRPVVPPARSGAGFAWPVDGDLVATFGSDVNGDRSDGIRIAAPRGTPVRAADNGTVAYAGNEVRGYGNLVLVRHEGDWITAYAHLDSILVSREEVLTAGQPLGTVGDTGAVASPVLHFEIREGTDAVDPLGLLPPR